MSPQVARALSSWEDWDSGQAVIEPDGSIGFSIPNPLDVAEDVVSGILHGVGDVAGYTARVASDVASGAFHVVTHPGEIPQSMLTVLAHPGLVAEPGMLAALFMLGPVGLAYAYGLDRAGVTRAVGKAVDELGGIYLRLIVGPACSAVSMVGGMPELAFGCLILSVGVDLAHAIVDHDVNAIISIVQKVAIFAVTYGLDVKAVLDGLLESVFRLAGSDFERVIGGMPGLSSGLKRVFGDDVGGKLSRGIEDAVPKIRAAAQAKVEALPADAVSSLDKLKTVQAGGKVSGDVAPSAGLEGGAAPPGQVDTILPFAPGQARKDAFLMNRAVMKDARAFASALTDALMSLRPNQVDDFRSLLSVPSLAAARTMGFMRASPAPVVRQNFALLFPEPSGLAGVLEAFLGLLGLGGD